MVANTPDAVRPRLWLGIEFAALYIGAPLAIALFMPGHLLFEALAVFSLVGLFLLWRTGGFGFRSLVRGWSRMPWLEVLGLSVATLLAGTAILYFTYPERLFAMVRSGMLPLIWVFYPILSALPQELIFRPLFFHRGHLFVRASDVLVLGRGGDDLRGRLDLCTRLSAARLSGGLAAARPCREPAVHRRHGRLFLLWQRGATVLGRLTSRPCRA
jgi:hypothetical protein